MTTIRMSEPIQDPRTRIWLLRKRIPRHLKEASGRRGEYVKISTGTADRREAKRRWPGVLARYAAMEAEWTRKAEGREVAAPDGTVSQQAAVALAGVWLKDQIAAHAANPGDPGGWAGMQAALALQIRHPDPDDHGGIMVGIPSSAERRQAADLLASHGLPTDPASVEAVGAELVRAKWNLAVDMEKRARGNWERITTGEAYPPLPVKPVEASREAPAVTLDGLLDAYEKVATLKARSIAETRYTVKALEAFLKHGDARRITTDDLRKWRDDFKATGGKKGTGGSNNTWNNRLSMVAQVFARAVDDGKLTDNPASKGLRLAKAPNAERFPFTDDEARRILIAARGETRPSIRWAHWVMAFSGMRVAEVLQMTRSDIQEEGGIWFMSVNQDSEGKSVKTAERRNVPMHPALIEEGFLAFALKVTDPTAPLFPDKRADAHGNRGGRAWQVVGRWVRNTVGITDEAKAPNHSWRHRIEDEMRSAEVPEDARDAITGHARKTTGRNYGVRREALRRLHRELSKVPAGFITGTPGTPHPHSD